MMQDSQIASMGYVCAPYMHNHESIELKDNWIHSKNVDDMFFATATFSDEGKSYFLPSANYYLIAKFKDDKKMKKEMEKFKQEKISFIFNMNDELFERETNGNMNYVSVYYLDYTESLDDLIDVADIVAKRNKVGKAGIGSVDLIVKEKPKFTFPYKDNIVVLEVSSYKSHQSVNQYCERTRRDVSRKGITLTNLLSLSILEKLK